MSKILVEKPTKEKLEKLNLNSWDLWECEPSTFDWEYKDNETAYVFEGKVKVTAPGQEVEIEGGDLVFFPKGLKCKWDVTEKIRKVFTFNLKDPISA